MYMNIMRTSDGPFPLVGRCLLYERFPWFPFVHLPGQGKFSLSLRRDTRRWGTPNHSNVTSEYSFSMNSVYKLQHFLTCAITSSICPELIFFSSFSTSGSFIEQKWHIYKSTQSPYINKRKLKPVLISYLSTF